MSNVNCRLSKCRLKVTVNPAFRIYVIHLFWHYDIFFFSSTTTSVFLFLEDSAGSLHSVINSFVFVYSDKLNNFYFSQNNEKIAQPFFIKLILFNEIRISVRRREQKIKRINENLRHKLWLLVLRSIYSGFFPIKELTLTI